MFDKIVKYDWNVYIVHGGRLIESTFIFNSKVSTFFTRNNSIIFEINLVAN